MKTPAGWFECWQRGLGAALCALLVLSSSLSPAYARETITFFHNDAAGSPMLATDVNGLQVWKETYRPYGDQLIDAAAARSNNTWFAGKPYDDSTGLSYMGARYYDPTLGRFMGVDPAPIDPGNLHSVNRYTYANNNPYRFKDPNGETAIPVIVVGSGILLGLGCAASENCRGAFSQIDWNSVDWKSLTSPVFGDPVVTWSINRTRAEAGHVYSEADAPANDSGTPEAIDDVIKELEQGAKVDDRGSGADKGIRNVDKTGTGATVDSDWQKIVGASGNTPKTFETKWGPGQSVELPGGGTASVRPGSKSGTPTIQIERPKLKPWKGRYD